MGDDVGSIPQISVLVLILLCSKSQAKVKQTIRSCVHITYSKLTDRTLMNSKREITLLENETTQHDA